MLRFWCQKESKVAFWGFCNGLVRVTGKFLGKFVRKIYFPTISCGLLSQSTFTVSKSYFRHKKNNLKFFFNNNIVNNIYVTNYILDLSFLFNYTKMLLIMNQKLRIKGERENCIEKTFKGNINFLDNKYFFGFMDDDPDYGLDPINMNRTKIIIGKKDKNELKYIKFNHINGSNSLEVYHLLQERKYTSNPFHTMRRTYSGNWLELNPSTEFSKEAYEWINDFCFQHEPPANIIPLIEVVIERNIGKIKPSHIEKILTRISPINMKESSKVRLSLLKNQYKVNHRNEQLKLDFNSYQDDAPF